MRFVACVKRGRLKILSVTIRNVVVVISQCYFFCLLLYAFFKDKKIKNETIDIQQLNLIKKLNCTLLSF